MRKTLLLFLFLVYYNVGLTQQFIIKVTGFGFSEIKNGYAKLNIQLAIKNTGNTKSVCDDLIGIKLYSSSKNNSEIDLIDAGENALDTIRPGDYINTFLVFKVPVNADDLSLKLKEESGGGSQYICPSYLKYSEQQMNEIFTGIDKLCYQNKYEDALLEIYKGIKLYTNLDTAFKRKTAEIFLLYGKYYYYEKNYLYSLKYFDSSAVYMKTDDVLNMKALSYERLGDEYRELWDKNSDTLALNQANDYYNKSQNCKYSDIVNTKIEDLKKYKTKVVTNTESGKYKTDNFNLLFKPNVFLYGKASVLFGTMEGTNKLNNLYAVEFGITPKIVKFKGTTFSLILPINIGASLMSGSSDQENIL